MSVCCMSLTALYLFCVDCIWKFFFSHHIFLYSASKMELYRLEKGSYVLDLMWLRDRLYFLTSNISGHADSTVKVQILHENGSIESVFESEWHLASLYQFLDLSSKNGTGKCFISLIYFKKNDLMAASSFESSLDNLWLSCSVNVGILDFQFWWAHLQNFMNPLLIGYRKWK